MRSIEYQDLEVFCVVVTEGSLRGASQRLNLGQPSVSRRMDRLEQCLGMELLDRSTRGVVLTDAGRMLLPYIDRGKHLMDEMFATLEGSSSAVRLQAWSDATLAPTAMTLIATCLPEVEVSNQVGSMDRVEQAILHGNADVGFAPRASIVDGVGSDPWFTDQLTCVVHPDHALATNVEVRPDDLSKHATALLDWDEATPVVELLHGAHIAPELLRRVAPGSTVAALAERGGHVGISTRSSLGTAIADGRLVELFTPDLPAVDIEVHLLHRRVDVDTSSVRAVRAAVEAEWRAGGLRGVTESFASVPAI
jgi:DNA-binding transcriptional LysR family regulator